MAAMTREADGVPLALSRFDSDCLTTRPPRRVSWECPAWLYEQRVARATTELERASRATQPSGRNLAVLSLSKSLPRATRPTAPGSAPHETRRVVTDDLQLSQAAFAELHRFGRSEANDHY
jgi:hypothetical protein